MKRMLSLLALTLFSITMVIAQDNVQYGYVKTKGTMYQVGDRIDSVRIQVKNGGTYETDARGEFELTINDKQFALSRVEKKGYELIDYETIGTNFDVSKNPLRIVMVSHKQLREDKERILAELQRKFLLEQAKNSNLTLELSNLQKSMEEMADRLARVDFDLMEAKDREIHKYLEMGEYAKADSLILSKGTIEERFENNIKDLKSVLDDAYVLATNAFLRNDIDSAIYFLDLRTQHAPSNVECLIDAGIAYMDYKTDAENALSFFNQALFFAKKQYGEGHSYTLKCKFYIANAMFMNRHFNKALPLINECLSEYNVLNLPIIYDRVDDIELIEANNSAREVVTYDDSTLVSSIYAMAIMVYGLQGNFDLALQCNELSEKYSCSDGDDGMLRFVALTTTMINAGYYREVLDQMILPLLRELGDDNHITAEFNGLAAMCYQGLVVGDSTVIYSDKVIDYCKKINQPHNQYNILAMIWKANGYFYQEKFNEAYEQIKMCEQLFDSSTDIEIPKDQLVNLYNTKGLCLYSLDEYEQAKTEYYKALDILEEESGNKDFQYNSLKGIIYSNLSLIYSVTQQYENAYLCAKLSFNEFSILYSDIGYKHPNIYMILSQMADAEENLNKYLEAFITYKMLYELIESEDIIEYINNCFLKATSNKQYSRTKEYKELKKVYQEWCESL